MSKYIKLEDAIEAYNQAVTLLVESEMEEFNLGDFTECSFNTTQIKLIARMIESLPTIEVSEEVLKATKKFNCYTIADENADMGMRTQIEPIIEVSEDCIDRKALLEQKYKAKDIFDTEYEDWFVFVPTIENAPSVIPQVPNEDCISRAYAIEVLSHVKKDEQWRTECIDNEIRLIELLPSVVPSRAKGEWINKQEKYQMAECSNCKKVTMHEMWGDKLVYYDYCPNCGAKMKG